MKIPSKANEYTVKEEQLSPPVDESTLHVQLAISNPSNIAVYSLKSDRNRIALYAVQKLNGTCMALNGKAVAESSKHGSFPSSSGTQLSFMQVPSDEQFILKVEHLSGRVTEKELIGMFGEHGIVKGVKLFETQTAFNYAYVAYSTLEDAEMAASEFDGADKYGVSMSVRLHTTSDKRRRISDTDTIFQDQKENEQYIVKVGQLPKCVKGRDLWDVFTPFGHVQSVNLVTTAPDFNSACINYTELEDAEAAAYELDGSAVFSNCPISVKMQDPGEACGVTSVSSLWCNTPDQLTMSLGCSTQLSTMKPLLSSNPGNHIAISAGQPFLDSLEFHSNTAPTVQPTLPYSAEIMKCLDISYLTPFLCTSGLLDLSSKLADIRVEREQRIEHLMTILAKGGDQKHKQFIQALKHDRNEHMGHQYLAALLEGQAFGTEETIAASKSIEKRLTKHILDFVQYLDGSELLCFMRQEQLLTPDEYEELTQPGMITTHRNQRILCILCTKGPTAHYTFAECLKHSSSLVPQHQKLCELISSNCSTEMNCSSTI